MIKIFFYGTHNFAAEIFSKITKSDKFDIIAVATAPDRQIGRTQQKKAPIIKKPIIELLHENCLLIEKSNFSIGRK